MPYQSALRLDYNHLFVGSNEFSHRFGVMPSLTFSMSDVDSLTIMGRYLGNNFINQAAFEDTPFDLDGSRVMLGGCGWSGRPALPLLWMVPAD